MYIRHPETKTDKAFERRIFALQALIGSSKAAIRRAQRDLRIFRPALIKDQARLDELIAEREREG